MSQERDGQQADRLQGALEHKESPFLTADELATVLRVQAEWVYRHARALRIPCFKLGGRLRFDPAEVVAWLQETQRPDQLLRRRRRGTRKNRRAAAERT